jgi:hypothetical protein
MGLISQWSPQVRFLREILPSVVINLGDEHKKTE